MFRKVGPPPPSSTRILGSASGIAEICITIYSRIPHPEHTSRFFILHKHIYKCIIYFVLSAFATMYILVQNIYIKHKNASSHLSVTIDKKILNKYVA